MPARVPAGAGVQLRQLQGRLRTAGARYPATPLGLLTVAALLPQDWEFRLLDLNVEELDLSLFDWADLVLATGMTPQQGGVLELIQLAHQHGKRIAVGGPGPSSQPEEFPAADYRVLDEGEVTIPPFLSDLRRRAPRDVPRRREAGPDAKPDAPVRPRRLLALRARGRTVLRGCPCNCEFCDIIEMHGRRPRTKTPEQMLRELDVLARRPPGSRRNRR